MWTGPREALMWTGLGLALLNMNWARLGWAGLGLINISRLLCGLGLGLIILNKTIAGP